MQGVGVMDLSSSGLIGRITPEADKLMDWFLMGSLCAMFSMIAITVAFWLLKTKD